MKKLKFVKRAPKTDALEGEVIQPQPLKGFGGPARVILTAVLIFFASQFLAVFLVELVFAVVHPHDRNILDHSIAAQFVYILIAEGLAIWLVVNTVRRRGLKLGDIGLGRKPVWGDLGKAAIGFLVFYGLLIAASLLVNYFNPDITSQKQNLGFNDIHTPTDNMLAFISLVILPPLGEEVLVRGYMFSGLRKYWRFITTMIVTSLIFGLAHLELGNGTPLVWGAAIDTFLLSIVLAFLRERTGALYAGILIHMLNNLIAFFVIIK